MSWLNIFHFANKLIRDTKANTSIIFALSGLPIVLALGSVTDYATATQRRTHLNAIADAAVLSAVRSTSMSLTPAMAQQQAISFFNSQASLESGIIYNNDVTVTVTDSTSSGSLVRKAVVTYSIKSINAFSAIVGVNTITIAGNASASATSAANIDFYMMVDTSPSMTIAATETGIATMVAATPSQGGCAFACHETNPSSDNLGNPGGEDNYALARSLGVALRMDLVTQAVSNMISTAQSTAQSNGAAYQVAAYTFDYAVNNPVPLTPNLATAQTQSSSISPLVVYNNNCVTQSNCNSDMDTNFDLAFDTLNNNIPTPGNGTNIAGDTPQKVLFLITDGVSDELNNGQRIYTPFGADPSWCSRIKSRGIRIAVLYTTYNPLPTNGWYNTYIAPEQSSIGPDAQACASSGLYYQVNTGGDISAALNALFQTAVASAHLTH